MNYDKTIDKLVNVLLENAGSLFRKTEQFQQLIEKHNEKSNNYETALAEREAALIDEYLEALNELTAAELEFVYIQGYKDCVHLLQRLGLL